MTLEQYFHAINQPKEETMFERSVEYLKNKWTELMTTKYKFVVPAPEIEIPHICQGDYWLFEMFTGEWYSDERGEVEPVKHTCIIEPHNGTWMEVLDKVIDELEKHYGYSIKEQVYYSVVFPMNEPSIVTGEPMAGYGRSLNDTVLQQLLLAYPEVYESFVDNDYTITGEK